MFSPRLARSVVVFCLCLLMPVAPGSTALAAGASFEIDLNELPKAKGPATAPAPNKHPKKEEPTRLPSPAEGQTRYTVKAGDHIFKILMKDFGLSNSQAEALIPAVTKLNNLSDIRHLRVGQTLLIPTSAPSRAASGRPAARKTSDRGKQATVREATPGRGPEPKPATTADFIPPPPPKTEPLVKEVPLSAPLPPVVPAPVEIHTLNAVDTAQIVDQLLELLDLQVTKNRIVESGRDNTDGTYISIKVDRFFSNRGTDYIVAIGVTDPFNLTLLRLLEVAGTQVVTLQPGESLASIAGKILDKLQWPYTFGKQQLKLSPASDQVTEIDGLMLVTGGTSPRQLLITDKPLPKPEAPASGKGGP